MFVAPRRLRAYRLRGDAVWPPTVESSFLPALSPSRPPSVDPRECIQIPKDVIRSAVDALQNCGRTHLEEERRMDFIANYVYSSQRATCNNPEDVAYMCNFGKALIIEEFDVPSILHAGKTGYRVNSGEYAGLNEDLASHRKRIHVYCDCFEGAYFANDLGDNYHYHIRQRDLKTFLCDASRQGSRVKIVGLNECGIQDEEAIWTVAQPEKESPDCVIYTPATQFVRTLTTTVDQDGNSWDDVSFGCVSTLGMIKLMELEELTKDLHSDAIYNYLAQPGNGDNYGVEPRNHLSSIAFGFSAMNCTDRTRDGYHNLPTAKLTTTYDNVKSSVLGHGTMTSTLKHAMKGMTGLSDSVCRVLRIPRQCDDVLRNKAHSETIIQGNRYEQITCAITKMDGLSGHEVIQSVQGINLPPPSSRKRKKPNSIPILDGGLACHTDNQNGKVRNYRGNVSHVQYFRNVKERDHNKAEYYRRMHKGVYSRRICETTHALKETLDELLHLMDRYIISQPLHLKKPDPTLIFVTHDEDEKTFYNHADMVARKPHCHKSVYYSFFVNELASWISWRKITEGVPDVDWPELVEAVMTAVRWTPSGSAWAQAFRSITSREGVEITVPADMHITEEVLQRFQFKSDEQGRPVLKFTNSYEAPLSLTLLYLCKVIETVGTVAGGAHGRFQAFCNLSKVNMVDEKQSMSQLMLLLDDLIVKTKAHEEKWGHSIDNNDTLSLFAKEVWDITESFIVSAGRARDGGGVYGLGHLNAHHVLGILAHLGIISYAHYLNTNFSKHNGTYNFLKDHGVDVCRRKGEIINIFGDHLREDVQVFNPETQSTCTRLGEGMHGNTVSENVVCKSGSKGGGVETILLGMDKFLTIFRHGKLIAWYADDSERVLVSGIVDGLCIVNDQHSVLDLTVSRIGSSRAKTSGWWEDVDYLRTVLKTNTFSANNDTIINYEKRRRNGMKKQRNAEASILARENYVMRVVKGKSVVERRDHRKKVTFPTFRYGYKARKKKELKSELRAYAIVLIQQLLQYETFDKLSLTQKNIDCSVRTMTQNILLKYCTDTNNKLKELLEELENVSSILNDDKVHVKDSPITALVASDMIETIKCQLRQPPQRITRSSQDDHDIYNPGDQSSSHLIYIQVSSGNCCLFPTYDIITTLTERFHQKLNLVDEMTKIVKNFTSEVGQISNEIKFSHDGRCFYRSQMTYDKGVISSSDKAFRLSSRSRKLVSINVGAIALDGVPDTWFLTEAHSKLALFFVVCAKFCISIEEKFLNQRDFALIYTDDKAYLENNPICCIARVAGSIIAVDLHQHKFACLKENSERESVRTKLRGQNKEGKQHSDIHFTESASCHFDDQFFNNNYASFIEGANMYMMNHLPVNSSKVDRIVPGLPGWLKVTIVYEDKKNKTTGKREVHLYFTPTYREKLRSLESVNRFNTILAEQNKNEKAALVIFRNEERLSKRIAHK